MFRKVHLKLTCLCALITVIILCLFAGIYLYMSEKMLTEAHATSFRQDMSSLCSSLEQQSVITFQYLLTLEQNSGYMLFLWDNKEPLYFNQLEEHAPYLDIAGKLSAESFQAEGEVALETAAAKYRTFYYEDENGIPLDVCIANIYFGQLSAADHLDAGEEDILLLLVLAPRTGFLQQLASQRLRYAGLSLIGCLLLTLFAWFFTGRLLLPIRESHEKQIQFVSDASHELRAPLAVISSYISVQPPNYKDIIQSECVHMSRLIEDMLTLTRLENHTRQIEKVPMEPDTLLLNLYEQMEPLAADNSLHLAIKLPETPLPRFMADPDRVLQVLMILTQNAISYTPTGGHVILSVHETAREIVYQVADDGVGIPDTDKKRVFERFYRSEASHTDKQHFGLGLCIAREIMQGHGGKITVTDTPGGGSTFLCIFMK